MEGVLRFALSNSSLTFLIVGLIASCVALTRLPALSASDVVAALLAYFVLFDIGFGFLYSSVMHIFFGPMIARYIGWADSPFQTEVGLASLGFAVVGFLAFRGSFDLRLAAVLGPALFLLGAAGVHLSDMVANHNFAPGNAGVIFYTDILIPVFGFVLLWLQRRYERRASAAALAR